MILGSHRDVIRWMPPGLRGLLLDWLPSLERANGSGRHEREGLVCVVEEVNPWLRAQGSPFWEGHQAMVDIQFVLSGQERCGWAPRFDSEPLSADTDRDLLVYPEPLAPFWLDLKPGLMVCFAPHDLHMPAMPGPDASDFVLRAVIKVPLSILGWQDGMA